MICHLRQLHSVLMRKAHSGAPATTCDEAVHHATQDEAALTRVSDYNAAMHRFSGLLARVAITIAVFGWFLLLRSDARAYTAQLARLAYAKHFSGPRIIRGYLRGGVGPKALQLGAGSNSKVGWLNTDIEPRRGQAYLDAGTRFPLPDASFQYVISEHLIEHLSYERGLLMLNECHRVLAPGGKIRIATPNLATYVELFRSTESEGARTYLSEKMHWHGYPKTAEPGTFLLNMEMHNWGHEFLYTPGMLRAALESCGFVEVKQFAVGVSDDPALVDAEARAHWPQRHINTYETMVLQAVRK